MVCEGPLVGGSQSAFSFGEASKQAACQGPPVESWQSACSLTDASQGRTAVQEQPYRVKFRVSEPGLRVVGS